MIHYVVLGMRPECKRKKKMECKTGEGVSCKQQGGGLSRIASPYEILVTEICL